MSRLRAALERLNPTAPPEAVAIAIESLTRNRATMSLVAANREVYDLLKTGIPVSIRTVSTGDRRRNGCASSTGSSHSWATTSYW